MIEKIKKNNLDINKSIMQVITHMREKNISAVEQTNNYEFQLKKFAKQILDSELKKIILTYCAEYSHLIDETKIATLLDTKLKVYESDELDAHGYFGTVEFSSGASKCLDGVYRGDNEKGNEDYISLLKQKSFNYSSNREEVIENDLDIRDYMNHAKTQKLTDLDFFLDCMPHELMHVFGFNGGIFEGVTESLTRQVASKYNIRCIPMGHRDETKFMQKIEKIIGTDKVIEYSYDKDKSPKNSNTDYTAISDELDKTIGSDDSKFKAICIAEKEYFKSMRSGATKEELQTVFQRLKSLTQTLNNDLDEYIDRNSDKINSLTDDYILEDINNKDIRQKLYQEIISSQNREIEMLDEVLKTMVQKDDYAK